MNVDEKAARERWCRDVHAAAMTGEWEKGTALGNWIWRMSEPPTVAISPRQMAPIVQDWVLNDDKIDRLRRENEKLRENLQDAEEPG